MACKHQLITDDYALYCGDCIEVMSTLPSHSVGMTIYSPPFAGLYQYSSDDRDMSNSNGVDDFMDHYGFMLDEKKRITQPGRMSAVHCCDIPTGNSGHGDGLFDLPGEIIRAHTSRGWDYVARYAVWKEPFRVRMRTMAKGLAHKTIVDDATNCNNAAADYLLVFRAPGENKNPVAHPIGLTSYAGEREPPADVLPYREWKGKQTENRYSHWVWRQYASAFWDDVRVDRVLPFEQAKEEQDEKHVHPLQLDVIERAITLWSNPSDVVMTPFMGVGSEAYGARLLGRKAVGVELKESYYRQAVRNVQAATREAEQLAIFATA